LDIIARDILLAPPIIISAHRLYNIGLIAYFFLSHAQPLQMFHQNPFITFELFRTKGRPKHKLCNSSAELTIGSLLQIVQETQYYPQQTNFFFSERVINVWNYLPYDIVCFKSLNAFKSSTVYYV